MWKTFSSIDLLSLISFHVNGQSPGVQLLASAHSWLKTLQPLSAPPPRPQELFTLNVDHVPLFDRRCESERSPR